MSEYEILVGDARAVKWVGVHGKLHPNQHNLVEGGREPSGSPQYIAQAPYHGAVYPAKACEDFGDGGCYVLHDGKEKQVKVSMESDIRTTTQIITGLCCTLLCVNSMVCGLRTILYDTKLIGWLHKMKSLGVVLCCEHISL